MNNILLTESKNYLSRVEPYDVLAHELMAERQRLAEVSKEYADKKKKGVTLAEYAKSLERRPKPEILQDYIELSKQVSQAQDAARAMKRKAASLYYQKLSVAAHIQELECDLLAMSEFYGGGDCISQGQVLYATDYEKTGNIFYIKENISNPHTSVELRWKICNNRTEQYSVISGHTVNMRDFFTTPEQAHIAYIAKSVVESHKEALRQEKLQAEKKDTPKKRRAKR